MDQASFRFFGTVNDFLASALKNTAISVRIDGHPAVKHHIEALGIPHVEVGEIRVNGEPQELTYRLDPGNLVEVDPPVPGTDLDPRFLLDNHLGRLAAYLRMLGFDCLYRNDYQDDEIAGLLENDLRILLSRDRRLLMRKIVIQGYCLRSLDPVEQLSEVVRRYALKSQIAPFRRCLRCNSFLEPVRKEAVLERLEPLTRLHYHEFAQCKRCDQVYWKGSHYERMQRMIDDLFHS